MRGLDEALKGHNIMYVMTPVFLTFYIKKNELFSVARSVNVYPIENFIKLVKSNDGIRQIYIYKDPSTNQPFWKTSIVTDGQEEILVVRGFIETGNNRYSLREKGRCTENEKHHLYAQNAHVAGNLDFNYNSNNT